MIILIGFSSQFCEVQYEACGDDSEFTIQYLLNGELITKNIEHGCYYHLIPDFIEGQVAMITAKENNIDLKIKIDGVTVKHLITTPTDKTIQITVLKPKKIE